MKSQRYLTGLVVLCGMIGVAATALADGAKLIVVTNNTSYTLTAMYASPSASSSDWDTSANLLAAGQTIAPGQTTAVTIADGVDHCHYDVMGILYGVAQSAYQYRIDACEGGTWNISIPY
jgi:hypothetical protein